MMMNKVMKFRKFSTIFEGVAHSILKCSIREKDPTGVSPRGNVYRALL